MNNPELDHMLDGIVETADCQQCGLCCTFHDDDKVDAPLFTEEQRRQVETAPYGQEVTFTRQNDMWQVDLTAQAEGLYACPLLDQATRMCNAREIDNFDCRAWPFYIMRKEDGETLLTLSPDCPAAVARYQNPVIEGIIGRKVLPLMIKHVSVNPGLIAPYREEVIPLTQVKLPEDTNAL